MLRSDVWYCSQTAFISAYSVHSGIRATPLRCSVMLLPVRFLLKIKWDGTYTTLIYVIDRTMVSVFCIALVT